MGVTSGSHGRLLHTPSDAELASDPTTWQTLRLDTGRLLAVSPPRFVFQVGPEQRYGWWASFPPLVHV